MSIDSTEQDAIKVSPEQLREILINGIQNNLNILVSGGPGTGKTTIISDVVTNILGYKFFISHPALDDPTDYKGLPCIVNEKAEFLPFGNLRKLVECKEKAVYFMDDLGQTPGSVQAPIMQLIHGGRVNGHRVENNIVFVGATNRKQDKSGVVGMYDALRSRFAAHVELAPSVQAWIQWAVKAQMPYQLISYVQGFGLEVLWDPRPSYDLRGYPNPRTLEYIGRWMNCGISKKNLMPIAAGECGYAWAQGFLGFLTIAEKTINPKEIIASPQTAEIPQDPSALYALCGSLASLANENNFKSIIEYTKRLEDAGNFNDRIPRTDYAIAVIKTCELYNKKICDTYAWIIWHEEHSKYIFDTNI